MYILIQSYCLCAPSHAFCAINIAISHTFYIHLFVFPVRVLSLVKPLITSLDHYLGKVNVSLQAVNLILIASAAVEFPYSSGCWSLLGSERQPSAVKWSIILYHCPHQFVQNIMSLFRNSLVVFQGPLCAVKQLSTGVKVLNWWNICY